MKKIVTAIVYIAFVVLLGNILGAKAKTIIAAIFFIPVTLIAIIFLGYHLRNIIYESKANGKFSLKEFACLGLLSIVQLIFYLIVAAIALTLLHFIAPQHLT